MCPLQFTSLTLFRSGSGMTLTVWQGLLRPQSISSLMVHAKDLLVSKTFSRTNFCILHQNQAYFQLKSVMKCSKKCGLSWKIWWIYGGRGYNGPSDRNRTNSDRLLKSCSISLRYSETSIEKKTWNHQRYNEKYGY